MEIIKQTFLFKLYHEFKLLFAIAVILIIGTGYCALKSSEEFPFLLYGMYSLKEETQSTYTTYSISIAGKEVDYSRVKDSQRELLTSPLQHTIALTEAGELSEADAQKFKQWLFAYSVDMRGLETNKMEVYKITCAYNTNGTPQILKRELMYDYETQ